MAAPALRNHVVLPPLVAAGPVLPPPPGWVETRLGGVTMGTTWSLIAFAPPGAAPQLRQLVEAECARIIALFSPWTPESEVSRLHQTGTADMSAPFMALLTPLMDLTRLTGGASDPALGALTDLWGFGPPGPRPREAALPAPAEIARALACSGASRLAVDGTRLTLPPGGRLDFSGSAKGYAADLISAGLSVAGFGSHLVEIGGEFVGRGLRPDMRPWWVEVEQPPGLARILIALNGYGLATSGDYRRYFLRDGQRYAHTIDPTTGSPLTGELASVSVLAQSAMRADALATALLVMGPSRGMDFARAEGLAAVMVRRGAGGAEALFSPALERMMEDVSQR